MNVHHINTIVAAITKNLSGSDTYADFSHSLFEWVGIHLLDPLKEEKIIGHRLVVDQSSTTEGEVVSALKGNTIGEHTSYSGEYSETEISFFGPYDDQTTFESSQESLMNGMAYHNKGDNLGYVYADGSYYELSYDNISFGGDYYGVFKGGLFPQTSISWKNIITQEEFKNKPWPPPADDPMSQFIFEVNIDPTPFKSRDVVIEYYVETKTTTPAPEPPEGEEPGDDEVEYDYRSDIYTYKKSIQNTVNLKIGSELVELLENAPKMDYTTGELL